MQRNDDPKHLDKGETPLVLAELADNAYYPYSDVNLPKDFLVFLECPEIFQWWGYFGKTYYKINHDKQSIEFIIAHRGTDNTFGLIEDMELWLDEILPAQYASGAHPFMQWAIHEFAVITQLYPDYEVKYHVVGHSLGASLAERTMLDTCSEKISGSLPPMSAMLFESPGLPASNTQALSTEIKENIGANTVVINTRVDAINTVYPPISDHQFHAPIVDTYYPRLDNVFPLPLIPSPFYYAFVFTPRIAHPIAGIVEYLQNNSEKNLLRMRHWPYGFEKGFDRYKNFDSHQSYWYGYADQLWFHNGLLSEIMQILFKTFDSFFNFYKITFLSPNADVTQENLADLISTTSIDDIWLKLSPESQASFQGNPANFKLWLESYSLQPRYYPYIDAVQTQLKYKLSELLHATNPEQYQYFFHTLLAINEELIRYKNTNLNFDEQVVVERTFAHFGLSLASINQPIPKSAQSNLPLQNPPQIISPTAADYKVVLQNFLDEQFKQSDLPENSQKYKSLVQFTDKISNKNFLTVEEAKMHIGELRSMLAKHRDTEGIVGFFNLFRNTDSLNRFYKYFDANNDIRIPTTRAPKPKH